MASTTSPAPPTRPRTSSPALDMGWALRVAALTAAAATATGAVIAPGLRGNAKESVVVLWERIASVCAYSMALLLVVLIALGAFHAAQSTKIASIVRAAAIACASGVVALVFSAAYMRLSPGPTLLLGSGATIAVFTSAVVALRAPHTRALGAVLAALALAAVLRLSAWEIATVAGDRASPSLYTLGRGISSLGVLLEASAQIIALTWIGARGGLLGRVASSAAILAAFAVTWAAGRGGSADAPLWQAVCATALSGAAGTPTPLALGPLAAFLPSAALFIALAAALLPRPPSALAGALALGLLARGTFDVPLRALAGVAAALWLVVTLADERALWQALTSGNPNRS